MNDFGIFKKMPKTIEDLGKLFVAKGFKELPKVQKIASSGHTALISAQGVNLFVFIHRLTVRSSPVKGFKSLKNRT